MAKRGCVDTLFFTFLLIAAFGTSSFFWFRLFVRGRSIPAPALVGRTLAAARATASDAGIILEVDNSKDRNAENVPVGAVVWQNRSAGSYVKRGTRIIVGQSLGPLVLRVPDLRGQSARTALLRFSQRNLKLGNVAYVPGNGRPGIVSENPPVGTIVPGQTPVSLLVSYAPPAPAYVMPDVIDRPVTEIMPLFESRGLRVSNVRYEAYPGLGDGVIIRQYPLNGAPVSAGDAITLVVTRQEQIDIIQQSSEEPTVTPQVQ